MKTIILLIAFLPLSWACIAQDTGAEPNFKDEAIGQVYKHYIHLKDVLVASNFNDAQKAAIKLSSALEGHQDMQKLANHISKATSLEKQRTAFTKLSNEVISLIKKSELTEGKVYVEYCPMANANTGGFWLANEQEIANPYFGSMMLKCGSVKEVIE